MCSDDVVVMIKKIIAENLLPVLTEKGVLHIISCMRNRVRKLYFARLLFLNAIQFKFRPIM